MPDLGLPPAGATLVVTIAGLSGEVGIDSAVVSTDGNVSLEVPLLSPCVEGDGSAPTLSAEFTLRDRDFHPSPTTGDPSFTLALLCQAPSQSVELSLVRHVFPDPQPVAGGLTALHVVAGGPPCASTPQGAYCWGRGLPGVEGLVSSPLPVPGGEGFRLTAHGTGHLCALDEDGSAWCWGQDFFGQLGVAGVTETSDPVQVETDLRFEELSANRWATCGRTAEGEVWCWGQGRGVGNEEALADATDASSVIPMRVATPRALSGLSSTWSHTCAVDADGVILCWGYAYRGEMGAARENGYAYDPVEVEAQVPFVSVAAGNTFTCALDAEGAAWCWGTGWDGQLGAGEESPWETADPVRVAGGHVFRGITAGRSHACGWTDDGAVWCWGGNTRGELGGEQPADDRCGRDDSNQRCSSVPVRVPGEQAFGQVSAGTHLTCGITVAGDIYCWGTRSGLGSGLPEV